MNEQTRDVELHLTEEEATVLTDYLRDDLDSLREEIYHTDDHDLRQDLKHRQQILRGVLGRLSVPAG